MCLNVATLHVKPKFLLLFVFPPFALFVLAVYLLKLSYRYLKKMNEEDIQALESWRDSLSTGAIPTIIRNCLKKTPVFLQVLGCKAVKSVTHVRYGLVIYDGKYSYAYGMLPKHLNHLVEDGLLEMFTIIKLKQFVIVCPSVVASGVDGKKGYEILLWDIVPLTPGIEVGEILGNPQTVYDEGVWTADVPTVTNNFVPFDQLPNLEDDSIIGKLSRCTII